jgi:hypothetical protein
MANPQDQNNLITITRSHHYICSFVVFVKYLCAKMAHFIELLILFRFSFDMTSVHQLALHRGDRDTQ